MQVALGLTTLPSPGASDPATDPAPSTLAEREALAVGSCVAEFRILRVLGSGGFGIVYLAYDNSLQRNIALKEYLPAMWAGRGRGGRLTVRSRSFADAFAAGLSSFVNEARLLARFDHPSLVKVHRFWEADGTAYMVMPYYEGVSLRQLRDAMDEPPTEAWLRRLLDSLLGALEVMHGASVFHRDVAPDNILLMPSGVPVLLDFGAARHVLMGQAQVLTAILKPLYAPIEQYAREAEVRQGPWTDIYAVAATIHHALTGQAPATSASRAVHDTQRPLHLREELVANASGLAYDKQWLEALDWGLAVMPQARPQSIAQWREALAGRLPVAQTARPPHASVVAPQRSAGEAPFPATELHTGSVPAGAMGGAGAASRRTVQARPWVAPGLAALVLVGGFGWLQTEELAPAPASLQSQRPGTAAALAVPLVPRVPLVPLAPADAPLRAFEPPLVMPPEVRHEPAAPLLEPVPPATASARSGVARPPKRFKPQATTSPQQLCAKLGFFGRFNCIRKTCATAKWSHHPQCTSDERIGYDAPPAELAVRPGYAG